MAEERINQLEQRLAQQNQLLQQLQQHAPQTGLALPNKFDDGDLASWLQSFDVCATANNWNDDARLRRMPTLLIGRAFAVYQRLIDGQRDTLAHLRENLTAAFLPPEQRGARYAEFDSCSLKDSESVEVYAFRLETLLRQAVPGADGDVREAMLKQRFIKGMPPTLRLELYKNPALTDAQFLTTARQIQAATKQLHDDGVVLSSTSSGCQMKQQSDSTTTVTVKTEPVAQANAIRGQSFQKSESAGKPQYSQNRRLLTCFNCGRQGHKAVDCR